MAASSQQPLVNEFLGVTYTKCKECSTCPCYAVKTDEKTNFSCMVCGHEPTSHKQRADKVAKREALPSRLAQSTAKRPRKMQSLLNNSSKSGVLPGGFTQQASRAPIILDLSHDEIFKGLSRHSIPLGGKYKLPLPEDEDLATTLLTLSLFSIMDLIKLAPAIHAVARFRFPTERVEDWTISTAISKSLGQPCELNDPTPYFRESGLWNRDEVQHRRKLMFRYDKQNIRQDNIDTTIEERGKLTVASFISFVRQEVHESKPLQDLATGSLPILQPCRWQPANDRVYWSTFSSDAADPSPYSALVSQLPDSSGASGFTDEAVFKALGQKPLSAVLDVSGSGKTRHLYELLCHRFGFYFVGSPGGNGGSFDLYDLTNHLIVELQSTGVKLADLRQDTQAKLANSARAKVLFSLAILARLVILEALLKMSGGRMTPKDWLLLQAYPGKLLAGGDIFQTVATAITQRVILPTNELEIVTEVTARLHARIRASGVPDRFPLIIDEAQALQADKNQEFFSPCNASTPESSSILTAYAAVMPHEATCMILAGTSLEIKKVQDQRRSYFATNVDKDDPFPTFSSFDGFRTLPSIRAALLAFGFKELAADEVALRHLFDTVRGRSRFLIMTLYCMLQRQNATDYRTAILETRQTICSQHDPHSLVCKINELRDPADANADLLRQLGEMVHAYTYSSDALSAKSYTAFPLLEKALCRFHSAPVLGDQYVALDEPMVVFAYQMIFDPMQFGDNRIRE